MSEATHEEEFAFHHSSPLSLRQSSTLSSPSAPPLEDATKPTFDYNVSDTPFDHALKQSDLSELSDDRRISGHSSISSFPASVLHHDVSDQRTPPVSPLHRRNDSAGSYKTPSPRRHRGFASAFRHPSSIREMQLNDDTGDDTESVVSHRSRMSIRSHHSSYSTNTSPSKRSSRSAQKKGSGLKKEFPLVLLHCTLLPPASNCLGPSCDKDLFAAILPEPYRQRWMQLQERLGSAELRSRGILLPHPQEEYDLLEERLLEALELEQPRIQSSHYFEQGGDSGFESGSQTDSEDADDKCPDCGKHLRTRLDKKWEIKVFAANGLMRGAAWTAAWRDMEKVDVEIGMFMPEEVRREVDTRLEALQAAEAEATMENTPDDREEVYERRRSFERQAPQPEHAVHVARSEPQPGVTATQLFLQDRRNIAIIILSFLVLAYAVLNARGHEQSQTKDPAAPASLASAIDTTVITSTEVWTTTLIEQDVPSSSSAMPSVAEGTTASAGELEVSTPVVAETGGEATAARPEDVEPQSMAFDDEKDIEFEDTGFYETD